MKTVRIVLTRGGTFEGGFDLIDEGGNPLDSSWTGRLEVRDRIGGTLLFAFADSGADGTLTIDDYGHCLLELPSSVTEDIPATADSLGNNSRVYLGGLEVWQAAAPTNRYTVNDLPMRVFVRPEVVTG